VPFLNSLPAETVAQLAAVATCRRASVGQVIFNEGEPGAGLFLIESGRVKISRFSREGREHIMVAFGRGDTFNDVPAFDGGPNAATAIALTDAVLWRIARPDLRRIAESHPELVWAMLESIARRTRHLVATVQNLSMRNVRERLARLLLEQAESVERGEIPAPLTQEEMASRLFTVREVVGRSLRALAADGLIEFDRNHIVIRDRAGLESAAEI
jgi:CRP/FNR family transcriptional regulator